MIPHSGIPLVEWLLATAIVLVVPLGLQHGRRPPHSVVVLLIAGLGAVAALFVADPMTSALLVLPYLLATLWLAAHALPRLLSRGVCAEALVDLGQLELPIAAFWLLASRAEWDLGYDPSIVALTAVHFHYAGFAAATVTGVVLRSTQAPLTGVAVGLGPPLVALGIALNPAVEVLSASVLAVGMIGLARAMVRARPILALPAIPLLGTMALAVIWAAQEFLQTHWLLMPRMAQLHGIGNALGFAVPALLLLRWKPAPEARAVPDISPLPLLKPIDGPAPTGLYESLEPVGLGDVPEEIAAYYLNSSEVVLLVRPRWRWGWLGVLAQRLTSALGNLVIPNADRVHRVSNQLAPMEAEGWVHSLRCYEDGRTMYDLGYAREGELMRAAGRLPLGSLDSLLRCRGGARPVLVTEGIYWVLGPARIRLPMEEELLGWVEDGHFRATHRFTLLGFAFLELHYAIAAAPKEELLA